MTRRQCEKCPWKKGVDPRGIPDGYSEDSHRALQSTIAKAGHLSLEPLVMMACHESPRGRELPCVGWLSQQLGEGNNLALRFLVISGCVSADIETVGPQHECFEDTLPKRRRPSKRARKKAAS